MGASGPAPVPPRVWGILNVTPDSFSDGGRYDEPAAAVRRALQVVAEGADVLDVGGESTRPGAKPVPAEEEAARVLPVLEALRSAGVPCPLSVDTRKASVARAALEAGAAIVNDVSAGTHDPELLPTAAAHGAAVVLMHMRGTPETMQRDPRYTDVVDEVLGWLRGRVRAAEAAGVPRERLWIDPGIGFGKTLEQNLEILRHLERFVAEGIPVLLGASRKSFLAGVTGREVHERFAGSLACVVRAWEAGVHAVRVHDVAATVDVIRVLGRTRPR